MKRTLGFEVLRCLRCSRKITLLATLTEPGPERRIVEPLGVRADPLTAAPARDPTWEQTDLGLVDAA